MSNLVPVDSLYFVIAIAVITTLSRSGLNYLDRYSFGYKKVCLVRHTFYSNFYPALVGFTFVYVVSDYSIIFSLIKLISFNLLLFSLASQIVAYTFSYALKKLTIKSVAISSKASDLLIIFYFYLIASKDELTNVIYALVVLSFFIPVVYDRFTEIRKNIYSVYIIILVLFFQAVLASSLSIEIGSEGGMLDIFLMALLVIFFRLMYSGFFYLITYHDIKSYKYNFFSIVNLFRAMLTLITQFGFVLVSTSYFPIIGFSILSCTTFLSIVISHFLLGESIDKKIGVALSASLLLIIFRTYSYVFPSQ